MAEWYYARDNQRLGPVSTEQLKQLASSGQLGQTDLVWKDGMGNWAAANTVPGLAGFFTPFAPAPAPAPAPRQAAVAAPARSTGADDVVQLMPGPSGATLMDDAMLIATRAVSGDLDAIKVSDAERAELAQAGITGDTAQRYLAWRRSMLWVAVVPLGFTAVMLIIDSAMHSFDSLNGFGILLEVLRILTLLGLPAAAAFAALMWSKPQMSGLIAGLGLLVCYGLPILILFMPGTWIATTVPPPVLAFSLLVVLASLPPAILRACLRVRTLLPESSVSGVPVVSVALLCAFFFAVMFVVLSRLFTTPVLGTIFGLCLVAAPLMYVVGARTMLRPIAAPTDRSAIALWQWIYYGLCGGAGFIAVVQMLATDQSIGFYGFWIVILLFLDFVGRSLFASVVASQYVLSNTRAALVAQLQLAKTEPGATLERRLGELEPVYGKM
jgi:hypothetical protein